MMRVIAKSFLRGLAAILPLFLTLYIFWWVISSLETLLRGGVTFFLPHEYYVPGLGLLAVVILICVVGFVLRYTFMDSVFSVVERLILTFPFVSTIYGGIKDFFDFFSEDNKSFSKAVVFTLNGSSEYYLGLVTSQETGKFFGSALKGTVAVYVPMSYQLGGFTLLVPEDNITEIDCSVPDALRYIMTAGVSSSGAEKPHAVSEFVNGISFSPDLDSQAAHTRHHRESR